VARAAPPFAAQQPTCPTNLTPTRLPIFPDAQAKAKLAQVSGKVNTLFVQLDTMNPSGRTVETGVRASRKILVSRCDRLAGRIDEARARLAAAEAEAAPPSAPANGSCGGGGGGGGGNTSSTGDEIGCAVVCSDSNTGSTSLLDQRSKVDAYLRSQRPPNRSGQLGSRAGAGAGADAGGGACVGGVGSRFSQPSPRAAAASANPVQPLPGSLPPTSAAGLADTLQQVAERLDGFEDLLAALADMLAVDSGSCLHSNATILCEKPPCGRLPN
jgi:hypothetical protein